MKTILSLLLWLVPALVFSQVVDSSVVRQVDSLLHLSRKFTGQSDFDKALEVNAVAEKLALENFGRGSATYASCCLYHGTALYYKTDYAEAEKWYIEAKSIYEKVLGKEHPDYAKNLNVLAVLYWSLGDYKKAEVLHIEALAIREKVLGKEHPDYSASLHNLAILYMNLGEYGKAEALYHESIAIAERTMGKENPDYAWSLHDLAILYYEMGDYEKAEALFLEALNIREKVLGKEHPDYASNLDELAGAYQKMSNYEKAEKLTLEAKAIREKVLGKEHLAYAFSLHNLATLYDAVGNYGKAEVLYLEAKDVLEKVVGKEHPDYAINLKNLANLYKEKRDYAKAETYFLEAKDVQEIALGKEHPNYAETLNGLAILFKGMGNYEKAEALFLESKAIREKALGKEHPDYAWSLHNLAVLYYETIDYKKAEALYLESKAILEKVIGKEHSQYTEILAALAGLYWSMGNHEKTASLMAEYAQLDQTSVTWAMRYMSEQELNSYLHLFLFNQSKILSFTQMTSQNESEQTAFNNNLFYKGFLLNTSSRINNLAQHDTAAIRLHNLLKSYHRRLAAEYTKPTAERKNVAELEEKANTTEKELVRTVAGYGEAIRQVNWQEVQSALKPGEAAIEFIHYNYYTPDPTDSVTYAALVLRAGDTQPSFIPLFEERQLTPLLRGIQGGDFDLIDQRYAFRNGKNPFHALIWQPLDSLLRGVNTIYCSPSGLLHRVNLGAVPLNAEQTFADSHHLVLLGSTRQLVVRGNNKSTGSNAALFGGIQYDSKIAAAVQNSDTEDDKRGVAVNALPFPYDTTLRGGGDNNPWRPLPATETEVHNIAGMLQKQGFQTALQTGPAATEETFKQLGRSPDASGPRILHLATHGYFFPDLKSEVRGETVRSEMQEPVFKISNHPMIRAGLILAGANPTWTTGKPPAQGEDGILTAYEISQINLSNTELVVLSACETGLGDLVGNEACMACNEPSKSPERNT